MHRLAFTKADTAKFISHLDLMRTFQRSFLRAGIHIKHTEGFNPHAFVSIPLPLSVGYSSSCEVLECEVLDTPLEEVPQRMNAALPAGITVQRCYEGVRPVKELYYVNYIVTLELILKAQNPGLNPELIVSAIRTYCPDAAPDYAVFHRRAVLDEQFQLWE